MKKREGSVDWYKARVRFHAEEADKLIEKGDKLVREGKGAVTRLNETHRDKHHETARTHALLAIALYFGLQVEQEVQDSTAKKMET